MRRSVFTKYMVAFAVMILIGFLLLAFIISSVINGYATSNIRRDVNQSTEMATDILEINYRKSGAPSFSAFIASERDTLPRLMGNDADERNILLVTNPTGRVLAGVNVRERDLSPDAEYTLSENIMEEVSRGNIYEGDGRIDGLFRDRYIVSGKGIFSPDGELVGAVFFCASAAREEALVSVMNRSVFIACLLVMLATMIAVYFISDRITSPLRSMTAATKDYARGKLETRVEIRGHDEIAELAAAFNSMAESLEETEKMRNSFLANVSHDLRTPMTTIAGFVDGMISGAIPDEKRPEYLEIVSSEVHRLSRLVSQILDISRLESGERKFTESRFDVCETARLILISFEQRIEEKRLSVDFSCTRDSLYVRGDSDAIHQVLYNLVENAIKFSPEEGTLRVAIEVRSPGKLQVTVYNDGEGIPEEDLPYVFERFYKTDKSRGLDKTGVGLGLYIVKTLLEAMHETVTVDSVSGEYCAFRFTLTEDRSDA